MGESGTEGVRAGWRERGRSEGGREGGVRMGQRERGRSEDGTERKREE